MVGRVGRPSRRARRFGMLSKVAGRGRDGLNGPLGETRVLRDLSAGHLGLGDLPGRSGGMLGGIGSHPGGSGGVGRPIQMAMEFGSPPKRSGRSREFLTGAGGSGGLSGGTGRFGRPSWRARRGHKALPESREWLGGLGEVGCPSQRAGMGRKAQQVGWEGSRGSYGEMGGVERPSGMGQEELAGPPRGPGGVGRPYKRVGGVGRPSRRARRVGRPSRWVGRDQEYPQVCWEGFGVTQEGWESWGCPPGGTNGVRRLYRMAKRGEEALPEGQDWLRGLPGGSS